MVHIVDPTVIITVQLVAPPSIIPNPIIGTAAGNETWNDFLKRNGITLNNPMSMLIRTRNTRGGGCWSAELCDTVFEFVKHFTKKRSKYTARLMLKSRLGIRWSSFVEPDGNNVHGQKKHSSMHRMAGMSKRISKKYNVRGRVNNNNNILGGGAESENASQPNQELPGTSSNEAHHSGSLMHQNTGTNSMVIIENAPEGSHAAGESSVIATPSSTTSGILKARKFKKTVTLSNNESLTNASLGQKLISRAIAMRYKNVVPTSNIQSPSIPLRIRIPPTELQPPEYISERMHTSEPLRVPPPAHLQQSERITISAVKGLPPPPPAHMKAPQTTINIEHIQTSLPTQTIVFDRIFDSQHALASLRVPQPACTLAPQRNVEFEISRQSIQGLSSSHTFASTAFAIPLRVSLPVQSTPTFVAVDIQNFEERSPKEKLKDNVVSTMNNISANQLEEVKREIMAAKANGTWGASMLITPTACEFLQDLFNL